MHRFTSVCGSRSQVEDHGGGDGASTQGPNNTTPVTSKVLGSSWGVPAQVLANTGPEKVGKVVVSTSIFGGNPARI